MTEEEFIEKWEQDKPMYEAWASHVVGHVRSEILSLGKEIDVFLKVPAKFRLKDNGSLVDKAFYRPGKNYTNPYEEIEDKVGVRFVVLLQEHIGQLEKIISDCDDWVYDPCKHYEIDRAHEPLLFTYQSVHFIVSPKSEIEIDGIKISSDVKCEIQLRTILQHAHAELTHDAIYKSKKRIQPQVHRTVAKSMALIETTDGFFSEATKQLNHGPLEEYGVLDALDNLYFRKTGMKSRIQKTSLVIFDEFEETITSNLVDEIVKFAEDSSYEFLEQRIVENYNRNALYQQSTIFYIYWMLLKHKRKFTSRWPLDNKVLQPIANDMGISLSN